MPLDNRSVSFTFTDLTRLSLTAICVGVMGSTFGRLSFIILMLQLFGITKWRRVALWTLFYAQLIPNCVVVITLYIQCDDVRALWDFSIKSSCWPEDLQTVSVVHSPILEGSD
jgi:hypothetical protein